MRSDRSLPRRYPVLSYFALSFALAWIIWIPVGLFVPQPTTAAILPGAWMPSLAALLLTAHLDGRAGVRALLRRLLLWRVGWRWYAFAVFAPTALALLAILIDGVLGGSPPSVVTIAARFGLAPDRANLVWLMLPLIFVVTIVAGGPIAEELGWRGFAQARLQTRLRPTVAGLVIGLLWSLWHLPLFFFLPSATGDIPLGWYIPLISAWGVLFGWLYSHTRGSVLLSVILHAGINFVLGALGLVTITGSRQLLTIFVILTAACAALAIGLAGRQVTETMQPAPQP